MPSAIYVQEGSNIDFLNTTGADIKYKDIIVTGSGIMIAAEDIAQNKTGTVNTEGVFEFPAINTTAFAIGDKLFWDATAGKITNVASGNTPVGYAVAAKAQAGTTAVVKLAPNTSGQYPKGVRFTVTYPQVGAGDVAKTFWLAPAACKIIAAQERHVTVAGQAGTLQIEKLASGVAPGSGDVTLASAFDLTSTANTPVEKAAVTTAAATLAKGDALALKVASGAATSYALGTITVTMEWL